MRFAISLLTVLAVASIIGTVLKQNEPYNNYLNQFGQFWFPVFEKLSLYAVYNAWWFLLILAFLVISTSTCIYRQTPLMLREMRGFREHAKEASLRQFAHHASLATTLPTATVKERVLAYLAGEKFAARVAERDDGVLLAAKAGSGNRLGYILAHCAIVLICLGGLLDGNLPLKLQMLIGNKQTTQGSQALSEIPPNARLGQENWSFRGNVFIPEGKSSDVAVLNVGDGILIQDLPFTVSLKKFHIDHYTTGAPKRFASDIILTDKASGKSHAHTIEVNKPFEYAGMAIYQASFDDGGTRLQINARSLMPGSSETLSVQGEVNDTVKLTDPKFNYTVEFTAFRAFNVENMAQDRPTEAGMLSRFTEHLGSGAKSPTKKDLRNVGPSFQFKLRDAAGQAREYHNYMMPIEQDGRSYLISGMRSAPSEPFRYLRLPMDEDGRADTFFALRSLLLDKSQHAAISRRFAANAMRGEAVSETVATRLAETAERTLQLFAEGGLESLAKFLESSLPASEQNKAAEVFLKVLQGTVWEAWQITRERAGLKPQDMTQQRADFVRDCVNSISDTFHYGAPIFMQLTGFDEVRASVLQVTRSPGKPIVFLGSALLVLGVFAMLYIRERRMFVLIKESGEALLAMSANRKTLDFDHAFERHRINLARMLQATP